MSDVKPLPKPFHGWINVYKPVGPTSFVMVKQVRRLLPRKTKVGHGGTLDPLANGILPIAVGEATKTVDYLMDEKKEYIFEVCWGAERTTDDLEGDILRESSKRPTQQDIEKILPHFIGELDQLPPLYSAKKIDGKRACDLAREGIEVILKPSKINVFELEIIDYSPEKTKFRAFCSKGTYIRSLARDMGQLLGCYGYTASILRSQVGGMFLEEALSLEKLALLEKDGILGETIKSIQAVLADIPAVLVTSEQEQKLRYGQAVILSTTDRNNAGQPYTLCVNDQQKAVAIVEADDSRNTQSLKPKRVFNIN